MGKMVQVEVTETGKHFLKSKIVEVIKEPGLTKPLEKGAVSGTFTNKDKVKINCFYAPQEFQQSCILQESY